jgi:hypothetical protein
LLLAALCKVGSLQVPRAYQTPTSTLCIVLSLVQITLTPYALENIAALDRRLIRAVAVRLSDLADGNWRLQQQQPAAAASSPSSERLDLSARAADRRQLHSSAYGSEEDYQNLVVRLADVRVYSMSFLTVGRIVFEVAPDYCEKYSFYVDMLRIWAVTLTDQEHGEALDRIISSYMRADDVLEGVKFLRPIINEVTANSSSASSTNEQEPVYYEEPHMNAEGGPGMDTLPIAFAQRRPQPNRASRSSEGIGRDRVVRVAPPASANQREFTMLRLLDLTDAVMQKLLSQDGLDLRYEDVPFRSAQL